MHSWQSAHVLFDPCRKFAIVYICAISFKQVQLVFRLILSQPHLFSFFSFNIFVRYIQIEVCFPLIPLNLFLVADLGFWWA